MRVLADPVGGAVAQLDGVENLVDRGSTLPTAIVRSGRRPGSGHHAAAVRGSGTRITVDLDPKGSH
jgi:hypothetical protein